MRQDSAEGFEQSFEMSPNAFALQKRIDVVLIFFHTSYN